MPMKNPLHPGRIVKHECLQPLNLTVKRAAEILGGTRQALSNIVNEKAAISADMAIRLEKAFGGTANAWLQMQNNYDLARARRHEDQLKVQRAPPSLPARREPGIDCDGDAWQVIPPPEGENTARP
jgi:addiction module HigA family antidote